MSSRGDEILSVLYCKCDLVLVLHIVMVNFRYFAMRYHLTHMLY
jgi:hypothetical protein